MGISTIVLCVKTREKLPQTLNGLTAKWVALLYSKDVASLASTQRKKIMAIKKQEVTTLPSKSSFARVCLNVLSANRTDRLVRCWLRAKIWGCCLALA